MNLGLGLFDGILLESSDDVVAKVVIIKHKWKYIIQMIQKCMMLWKEIINISYHDWTMVWTTLDTLNIRNGIIVWSMVYIAFSNKKKTPDYYLPSLSPILISFFMILYLNNT